MEVDCTQGWRQSRVRRMSLGDANCCFRKPSPNFPLTPGPSSPCILLLESLEIVTSFAGGIKKNAEKARTYLVLDLQVAVSSNDQMYLQKGEHSEARNGPGACGEGRQVRRGGLCRGLGFARSQSRIWS